MNYIYILLLLIATVYPAFSQTTDKQTGTLKQKKSNVFNHKTDSLTRIVTTPYDSLMRFNQFLSLELDSLTYRIDHKVGQPKHNLDSITVLLNRKIDSLRHVQLSYEKYTKVLDSLKQLRPLHHLKQTQQKVAQLQAKVEEKLNKPLGVVNEKLREFSQKAGMKGEVAGNLPASSLPASSLPTFNLNQKDLSSTLSNVDVKDVDVKDVDVKMPIIDNPLQNKLLQNKLLQDKMLQDKLLDKELNLGEQINIHSPKVDNSLKEININQGPLVEVAKVGGLLTKYSQDTNAISSGNIEQISVVQTELFSSLPVKEKVTVFEQQQKALTQLEAAHTSLRNKEEFKKQTWSKTKQLVARQLDARNIQIQETVDKVSIYQKKAGGFLIRVKGLPKKRPEKDKRIPMINRFMPGLTLQIQKTDFYLIDLNPAMRFKLFPILSIGAGWNQRFVLDKERAFRPAYRVYGVRGFGEMAVLKGFSVRVDIERMNVFVPFSRQSQDRGERKWVSNYMVGVKKEFTLFSGVSGNTQFMYNIYDTEKVSPYVKRFNVRFGFEFPVKKKKVQNK